MWADPSNDELGVKFDMGKTTWPLVLDLTIPPKLLQIPHSPYVFHTNTVLCTKQSNKYIHQLRLTFIWSHSQVWQVLLGVDPVHVDVVDGVEGVVAPGDSAGPLPGHQRPALILG